MARDWDKYEAELREEIERKVARAMDRAKRHSERAERKAELLRERAERHAERVRERGERAAERARERLQTFGDAASQTGDKTWLVGVHGVPKPTREQEIAIGVIVLVVGAALLLANLGFFGVRDVAAFWPAILIAWGAMRVSRSRCASGKAFGIFMLITGTILLLGNLHIVHVSWNLFWPAILILVGVQHLAKNFDPPQSATPNPPAAEAPSAGTAYEPAAAARGAQDPETPTSGPRPYNSGSYASSPRPEPKQTGWTSASGWSSAPHPYTAQGAGPENVPPPQPPPPSYGPDVYLHEYCIFTGGKRVIQAGNFRGGELVAVFGGLDIDLRRSHIIADEATLDITAAFGGCEIHVPESWYVEMRGIAAFGGYTDKTIPPRGGPGQRIPKLVVTGTAAFGGVVIKN